MFRSLSMPITLQSGMGLAPNPYGGFMPAEASVDPTGYLHRHGQGFTPVAHWSFPSILRLVMYQSSQISHPVM